MYFKKSYAEQLFQIALALSLFQVDYHRNFFNNDNQQQQQNQFQNYGNRNNWEELQMLHAVPTASFPYANRKAMIPLIEDLIRFDRNSVDLINQNVTAYLLVDGSSNQTNPNQEEGAVAVETLQNYNSSSLSVDLELDLFDEFGTSIFEQNLSDLRDFGEIPILSPLSTYNNLPLKDEPVDYFVDIKVEDGASAPVAGGSTNSDSGGEGGNPNPSGNSTLLNPSCCDVYNATKQNDSVKVEKSEESESVQVKQENVEEEEEIEAVDVLWKQDVDLGYSLPTSSAEITKKLDQSEDSEEDIEKLKALEDLKNDKSKDGEKDTGPTDEWSGINYTIDNETGEYIRLPLQLDEILENLGNLVEDLKEEEEQPVPNPITEKKEEQSEASEKSPEDKEKDKACDISPLPSPLFNLDEAAELDEIDMMIQSHHHKNNPQSYGPATATNSAFRQSGFHQPRGPLSRNVSMEQRLQDIANFFNPIPGMGMGVADMPPYSHYSAHYPYQAPHQHSQFTHPAYSGLGELNGTQPHYGHNLGSAVTSSMHLTNSSHDSADNNSTSGYKIDHDMMYYSNTSSEMNHTTEGFINSILNDEDLHLMDMNVTDSNYMRMIDNSGSNTSSLLGCATGGSTGSGPGNMHAINGSLNISNDLVPGATGLSSHGGATAGGDRLDASSDSAVSSMGSERVPSLSDGEWGEGSDSAQDFHHGKYGGPYDYSYNNRMGENPSRPPVAQKKHQMYGKRFFSEQAPVQQHSNGSNPPIKYEYDSYNTSRLDNGASGISATADIKYAPYADFGNRVDQQPQPQPSSIISHNHTYSMPQGSGINPRPQQRDKKTKNKSNSESSTSTLDSEHLSRDEKRARALNIPIPVTDIINLPMDEFNERLSKYELSENQLSLIRDIRRRGKNKVAAQNCRKRKLDQIVNLEDEVKEVRQRKAQLYGDRDSLLKEKKRVTAKFQMLHSHIFQYLRDSDGNPCSPNDYTLQQAADGSVYLLRKDLKDAGSMQNHHHNNKHKE